MFRKILKYTLRVLAILAGLIVLLVVSLYLPPVQDFIQKKATEYLSEELGMRLSIERFRLRFPLRLSIDRAQGITPDGDTLFYCGSLRTAVALKPLLGGEVHIRNFAIDSAAFHLAADSTSGLDLKLRVRELALSGRADLSTESVQVPDIRLSGGDIRLILGPSVPDTTAVDTASASLLWKIAAQRLTLDDIAFAMHTPESATDLTARIARGEVDSCAVDLGTQEITAHRLLIERGGTELGSLAADAPIYPASMTKIMTVLLGIENLPDLEAAVTLDADIYADLWAENASMAGFYPGETVTVRDILYGSLLPSGAECSVTIARLVDGSVEAFAARMNDRAATLGLTSTHFVNPTGLHDPQQVSTVRDIARLLDAALDNPTFRDLFTTQSYTTAPTDVHPDGLLLHSVMFAMLDGETAPGVTLLGGKTGFTDQAGQCLASLAACGGKEYILVTAGAPGDNSTGDYQHITVITDIKHFASLHTGLLHQCKTGTLLFQFPQSE